MNWFLLLACLLSLSAGEKQDNKAKEESNDDIILLEVGTVAKSKQEKRAPQHQQVIYQSAQLLLQAQQVVDSETNNSEGGPLAHKNVIANPVNFVTPMPETHGRIIYSPEPTQKQKNGPFTGRFTEGLRPGSRYITPGPSQQKSPITISRPGNPDDEISYVFVRPESDESVVYVEQHKAQVQRLTPIIVADESPAVTTLKAVTPRRRKPTITRGRQNQNVAKYTEAEKQDDSERSPQHYLLAYDNMPDVTRFGSRGSARRRRPNTKVEDEEES